MKFRFEEAERAYLQAIEAKPEGFEANFAYGLFNQGLNRFGKARAAYGRCLEGAKKNGADDALAQTLNNLGHLDSDQNRPEEARQALQEALQTYRKLAQTNPEVYLPKVADTLYNLGALDSDQNRPEKARQKYREALRIYEAFAKQNPERFSSDVARVKGLLEQLPR